MSNHLLQQLVKYDEYDIPMSANPQITYFKIDRKTSLTNKRHTNFASGIIPIEKSLKSSETKYIFEVGQISDIFDSLTIVVHSVDFFNILKNISLSICGQQINLSPEYLQIYSKICSDIIYTSDTSTYITLPLSKYDFFKSKDISNDSKNIIYQWLTRFDCLYDSTNPFVSVQIDLKAPMDISVANSIELKLSVSELDSEERRNIAFNITNQKYNIIPSELECFCTSGIKYPINLELNIIVLGIELPDGFESLESIQIYTKKNIITLTPNIIKMFNQMYSQIIFDNVIKLRGLINTTDREFKIQINTIQPNNQYKLYHCTKSDDTTTNNFIFAINDEFTTFYKEYTFEHNQPIQIKEESQYHLTELQILQSDIKISNVNLKIKDDTEVYNNIIIDANESIINQKKKYNQISPNYFTISFALNPTKIYQPTSHYNISPYNVLEVLTVFDTKNTDKIHMIASGYQSEKIDNNNI